MGGGGGPVPIEISGMGQQQMDGTENGGGSSFNVFDSAFAFCSFLLNFTTCTELISDDDRNYRLIRVILFSWLLF